MLSSEGVRDFARKNFSRTTKKEKSGRDGMIRFEIFSKRQNASSRKNRRTRKNKNEKLAGVNIKSNKVKLERNLAQERADC